MSSDRGGRLKSQAECFARRLQNRLKTLSESQDDGWTEGGDTEVYYDIESPLASPEEEVAEPVFIATQNRDRLLALQRTDSEASTYYDSLESFEELKTMSPLELFKVGHGMVPTVENGIVDFLDSNTSLDNFGVSSLLKLKNENITGNINRYDDAGSSGTLDSLRLELEFSVNKTDNVCDIDAEEENNNIGQDFEEAADYMFGNNCDVTVVEVDTRQSEDASTIEMLKDVESKDMYCVFCDIEQIKTGLANDCNEISGMIECDSENNRSNQINGYLEEDLLPQFTETSENEKAKDIGRTDHQGISEQEIPQIIIGNYSNESFDTNENSSLSNSLRKLKIEITNESVDNKGSVETEHSTPLEDLGLTAREPSAEVEATTKRCEVDEFDIETKRKHFQRSSSLKSGKTPPGTPGRKKIVRFADVLGLDLADVKTFLDEVPTVPKSAYEDLHGIMDLTAEPVTESFSNNMITVIMPQVEKVLTPLFQQPCVLPDFLDRVRQHNVTLENAIVSDMSLFAISGLVRVKNMDFHKSVHVRYSINNWHSFSDLQARYIPNSCDGFSDKFSFTLYAHTLSVGQRLEFAVRFQTAGAQFWDNNGGLNYVFECKSLLPANLSGLPVSCHDVTAAFY